MKRENLMEKWNAVGFDAEMFDLLPEDTELRVRMDMENIYTISKKDALDVKMTTEFGEYGKQYFIKLDAFTLKK